MIAQVFKDVYKQSGQQVTNNQRRRPAREEVRRAQVVEEDESD